MGKFVKMLGFTKIGMIFIAFRLGRWITKILMLGNKMPGNGVVVIPSKSIAYFPIAKCGCSFIKKMILSMVEEQQVENKDIHYCFNSSKYFNSRNDVNELAECKWMFALVRNPFARIVSFYKDKIELARTEYRHIEYLEKYYFGMFNKEMTFSEFVYTVCDLPDDVAEIHFRSQFDSLPKKYFNRIKIFRIEEMDDVVSYISNKMGVANGMQYRPVNKRDKYDYRSYFTLELFELIFNRYSMDVIKFGYLEEAVALRKYLDERERDRRYRVI